jgi:hypothetical protein
MRKERSKIKIGNSAIFLVMLDILSSKILVKKLRRVFLKKESSLKILGKIFAVYRRCTLMTNVATTIVFMEHGSAVILVNGLQEIARF